MTSPRPSLVAWPAESARRDDLAAQRLSCVLVLDASTPVPVLGDHEDLVRRDASEADAAARLASVARRAADPAIDRPLFGLAIPQVPPGLTPELHRWARRLLASPGGLVRWSDDDRLGPADVARLRRALRAHGWELRAVGVVGHLVEPSVGSPA